MAIERTGVSCRQTGAVWSLEDDEVDAVRLEGVDDVLIGLLGNVLVVREPADIDPVDTACHPVLDEAEVFRADTEPPGGGIDCVAVDGDRPCFPGIRYPVPVRVTGRGRGAAARQ